MAQSTAQDLNMNVDIAKHCPDKDFACEVRFGENLLFDDWAKQNGSGSIIQDLARYLNSLGDVNDDSISASIQAVQGLSHRLVKAKARCLNTATKPANHEGSTTRSLDAAACHLQPHFPDVDVCLAIACCKEVQVCRVGSRHFVTLLEQIHQNSSSSIHSGPRRCDRLHGSGTNSVVSSAPQSTTSSTVSLRQHLQQQLEEIEDQMHNLLQPIEKELRSLQVSRGNAEAADRARQLQARSTSIMTSLGPAHDQLVNQIHDLDVQNSPKIARRESPWKALQGRMSAAIDHLHAQEEIARFRGLHHANKALNRLQQDDKQIRAALTRVSQQYTRASSYTHLTATDVAPDSPLNSSDATDHYQLQLLIIMVRMQRCEQVVNLLDDDPEAVSGRRTSVGSMQAEEERITEAVKLALHLGVNLDTTLVKPSWVWCTPGEDLDPWEPTHPATLADALSKAGTLQRSNRLSSGGVAGVIPQRVAGIVAEWGAQGNTPSFLRQADTVHVDTDDSFKSSTRATFRPGVQSLGGTSTSLPRDGGMRHSDNGMTGSLGMFSSDPSMMATKSVRRRLFSENGAQSRMGSLHSQIDTYHRTQGALSTSLGRSNTNNSCDATRTADPKNSLQSHHKLPAAAATPPANASSEFSSLSGVYQASIDGRASGPQRMPQSRLSRSQHVLDTEPDGSQPVVPPVYPPAQTAGRSRFSSQQLGYVADKPQEEPSTSHVDRYDQGQSLSRNHDNSHEERLAAARAGKTTVTNNDQVLQHEQCNKAKDDSQISMRSVQSPTSLLLNGMRENLEQYSMASASYPRDTCIPQTPTAAVYIGEIIQPASMPYEKQNSGIYKNTPFMQNSAVAGGHVGYAVPLQESRHDLPSICETRPAVKHASVANVSANATHHHAHQQQPTQAAPVFGSNGVKAVDKTVKKSPFPSLDCLQAATQSQDAKASPEKGNAGGAVASPSGPYRRVRSLFGKPPAYRDSKRSSNTSNATLTGTSSDRTLTAYNSSIGMASSHNSHVMPSHGSHMQGARSILTVVRRSSLNGSQSGSQSNSKEIRGRSSDPGIGSSSSKAFAKLRKSCKDLFSAGSHAVEGLFRSNAGTPRGQKSASRRNTMSDSGAAQAPHAQHEGPSVPSMKAVSGHWVDQNMLAYQSFANDAFEQ